MLRYGIKDKASKNLPYLYCLLSFWWNRGMRRHMTCFSAGIIHSGYL